jgi:uncharacterized membrane protein YhfC
MLLKLLYALNFLLMMGLPLVLGAYLARRFKVSWSLFLAGGVTFILSQVGHIPFNAILFNRLGLPPANTWPLPILAVVAGLSAGVFEETARYLVYRFWIKNARTWHQTLMFGAGHGGVEAIIFGALGAITAINLIALQNKDLETLGLTGQQQIAVQAQMVAFLTAPWYMALLGAVERVWAITFHLSAAVLVLQVFRRRNILWLGAAILWHTVLNAVTLIAVDRVGAVGAEGVLGVLTLGSLAILYGLRDRPVPEGAEAPPPAPLPAPMEGPLAPRPVTDEALKETRYQ